MELSNLSVGDYVIGLRPDDRGKLFKVERVLDPSHDLVQLSEVGNPHHDEFYRYHVNLVLVNEIGVLEYLFEHKNDSPQVVPEPTDRITISHP